MDYMPDGTSDQLRRVISILYPRFFNIAKASSFDLEIRVHPQRNVTNFRSNVLAFAITIGPNEQRGGVTSLRFDILGNGFFVLGKHKN